MKKSDGFLLLAMKKKRRKKSNGGRADVGSEKARLRMFWAGANSMVKMGGLK